MSDYSFKNRFPSPDHLLRRKAQGLLRKMEKGGALLQARPFDTQIRPDENISQRKSYQLVKVSQSGLGKKSDPQAAPISGEMINFLMAHDWIEAGANDTYILSETGLAFLRREEGGEEPFRAQHHVIGKRTLKLSYGGIRQLRVNEAETPLGWLRKRKDKEGKPLIDECQYEAGERLRQDFTYAQMMPRVTADWSFTADGRKNRRFAGGVQSIEMRENVIAAKARVTRALEAVGPELCGVLIDVCCHLNGLEEAEKKQGWPQRSGKIVLQIALTRLARHYGLLTDLQSHGHFYTKILQWGAEDYRPEL